MEWLFVAFVIGFCFWVYTEYKKEDEKDYSESETPRDDLAKLNKQLKSIVFVDVETTGLSWKGGDRVITLAALTVKVDDSGEIHLSPNYWIFNPERKSHPKAAKVHGYKEYELAIQDAFADHGSDVYELLNNKIIVAHNVQFDIGFLENELDISGLKDFDTSGTKTLCTMKKFKELYPNERANLANTCKCLDIEFDEDDAHDALYDVQKCCAAFLKMFYRISFDVIDVMHKPSNYNELPNFKGSKLDKNTVQIALEFFGTKKATAIELGITLHKLNKILNGE